MSLENNLYVPENIGFYNEESVFTVSSENAGITAQFINEDSNTILLRTHNRETDTETSFAFRNANNTLSISQDFNEPILEINDNELYVNRDLYFINIFPQKEKYTTLGSAETPINYIYTENIFIDDYTIFTKHGELYKRYEPTGHVSKIMTEQIESIRWKNLKGLNNVVYLEADLIIDNDLYVKGSLNSNIDISSFQIDYSKIDIYGVGLGKLDNPNIKAHGDTVIINDAWKLTDNMNTMFSSKTVIIHGNIYINGNIIYDPIITSYRIKQYSIEEIGFGNTEWCNVNDSLYTSKPVWIDGDVLASGNITLLKSTNIQDIINTSNQIYYPTPKALAETVNIIDKAIINEHKTVIQNTDDLELNAKALLLKANNIHLDGDISLNPRNIDLFKEIFEHSAVYNSMDLMQKRYTYTGQIPIRKGYKHEIGYYITWSATPTPFNIFELKGNIFMADTIRELDGGLRVKGSFSLSINPYDNGADLPNMDKLFEYNSGKTKQIISKKGIRLQVTKITGKNVKLSLDWETDHEYREEYHAHINIDAHIPGFLGKRMVFTPFHNILEGAENDYDTKAFHADQFPLVNDKEDYRPAALPGGIVEDLIISGRLNTPSLIVEKPSINKNIRNIAEFWDKTEYEDYTHDDDCAIVHHNKVARGVKIGKDGQTFIGYPQYQDDPINYDEEAQLNIRSDNEGYRMKIEGKYNKTIFDKNGNLIINNNRPFNQRVNLSNKIIDEYALDVTGNVSIKGTMNINNNQILRGLFNLSNKQEKSHNNVLKIYITWALESGMIIESNNNIIMSIFYNISSYNTESISVSSQEVDIIIDPRNNNVDKPNSILTMFKSGVYSQLYSNITVDTDRLSENAVLMKITTHGKEISDNISYASIQMVGSEVFYQFSVESELTYYGIQDLTDSENINLVLTHIPQDINLYQHFNIDNRKEVYFEIIGSYDSNMYDLDEEYQLFLYPNIRDTEYSFGINAYNKRGVLLNSNLTISVKELPPISLIDVSNIYLGDVIINKYPQRVYQYYDISLIYPWEEMSNYLFFDTRFEVIDDEVQIDAKLSGQSYTVDVALYYKGTNTIDHMLLDNSLTIYYDELTRIVVNSDVRGTPVNTTSNTIFDLYDFYNVSSNVTFSTYYSNTDRVYDYMIDESRINIIDDVQVVAYYYGFYEYTSNLDLSFKVDHIETIYDEPIELGWIVMEDMTCNMWDFFDVTAKLDDDYVEFIISIDIIESDTERIRYKSDSFYNSRYSNVDFETIQIQNEDFLNIRGDTRDVEYCINVLANYTINQKYNNSISFKIKEVPDIINTMEIIEINDVIIDNYTCNLIDYYNVKNYKTSVQQLVGFEAVDVNGCNYNNISIDNDEQQLTISGNLRGATYDIQINAFYKSFKNETINNNLIFRITEVPSIDEKAEFTGITELPPIILKTSYTCNLFEYFNIDVENQDIISFSLVNINNCNNINVDNSIINNDMVIVSDQRGIMYDIGINAFYDKYPTTTINNDVIIRIDEVIDIQENQTSITIEDLVLHEITCNLFDYYNVLDRHENLVSFEYINVYNCNIDVNIENQSNIVIKANQRGYNYDLKIEAYYTGYKTETMNDSFTIKVEEGPELEVDIS